MSSIQEFNDYRQRMNDRIMAQDNKVIKRFWSLDNQTYQAKPLMSGPRKCWVWWHPWYCDAMIASNTISSAVMRKA